MSDIAINSMIDGIAAALFLIALGYLSYVVGFVKGSREQDRRIFINVGELRDIVHEVFRAGLEEKKRMEEVENE